jgi:ribosomal protein S27E
MKICDCWEVIELNMMDCPYCNENQKLFGHADTGDIVQCGKCKKEFKLGEPA